MKSSHGELNIISILRTFHFMGLILALGKHCLQDSVWVRTYECVWQGYLWKILSRSGTSASVSLGQQCEACGFTSDRICDLSCMTWPSLDINEKFERKDEDDYQPDDIWWVSLP